MPDAVVDCVITSPPYYQLRDYGVEGQWGLEKTYLEYLEKLWGMMDEIWRVLKDDGTVWINLGDSYAGSCGMGSQYDNKHAKGMQIIKQFEKGRALEIKNKSLMLIPHRFAIGCIERGWILRNDIIWAKRNGMPESVRDRFSKKHEFIFFFTKKQKYYFDLDAVRDDYVDNYSERLRNKGAENWAKQTNGPSEGVRNWWNKGGKNPGDVADFWDIPTKPSSDKHFASYNTDLIKKPVLAGCKEGGLIYDPFMGTGTTAYVALSTGRNYVGSELNREYIDIAERRLEPLKAQTNLFDMQAKNSA